MKKRVPLPICIMIVLFCTVMTFQITFVFCSQRARLAGRAQEGDYAFDADKLAYVDRLYRENFVGQMDQDALTDALIDGYLSGAGERFGTYLTAAEYEEYTESLSGDLVGVGVNVIYNADYGLIEVLSVMEGTPAEQAGILPGDLIQTVDGKDAAQLGYYGTIAAVRGQEGSEVTLTVLRPGSESTALEYRLMRTRITMQSVFFHMYDQQIGVIRITEFNTATVEQFEEALAELAAAGAKAVVFDLRGNPGGELNSITSVLDLLLPEGDIIIATDKDGNKEVLATSDANELTLPMATLINGSSASAAELFAGSMRDYGKGPLIGETTFGKGTMQTLMPLPDGSAVSISNRNFTSKSGNSHDGVGIEPDIKVELSEEIAGKNLFLITDEEDNVLARAVQYLTEQINN